MSMAMPHLCPVCQCHIWEQNNIAMTLLVTILEWTYMKWLHTFYCDGQSKGYNNNSTLIPGGSVVVLARYVGLLVRYNN